MRLLPKNFFRTLPPPPLIEPQPSPAERERLRRDALRRALSSLEPDDIITITVARLYDRNDIAALRDLSRTADRAADYLERTAE
jgi:hypothetical protein